MKNPMHRLPTTAQGIARIALVGAVGLAACNQDLIAPVPDFVLPEQIAGTAALNSAYAAAVSDFQVAYAGSGTVEGIVNISGMLSDELFNAETFVTRIEVDKRSTNPINSSMLPIFRNIHRARHTAELVEIRFAVGDSANPQRAEVQALAAYTYLLLAENYCNGVPTTNVADDGSLLYGAPQTTDQLYAIALQKFDSAIARATPAGTAGAQALNLARVGKGRVLNDQAQYALAAAAVAAVPTSFAYVIQHDANTTRQNNGVFAFMFSSKRFTVANKEGTNGLPFVSSGDTRVAAFRLPATNVGFDGTTPEFQTLKYQDRASPTPVALGTEARLIQAEAFNQTGDTARFFAYLDSARINSKTYAAGAVGTSAGPMAPIPTATRTNLGATARVDLLFSERAFDLFLTAHRVGDMRRLIRRYNRDAETVFPTGVYPGTKTVGNYGADVNLPIPFEEVNNPAFTGCIDRGA